LGSKTKESQCSDHDLKVKKSIIAISSYFRPSSKTIASMVKHHKRKAAPTVQRVTWVDKLTTRGVSTRQIRVSTPKTVRRSTPAKPSASPWKVGSHTDLEEQYSSEPLRLPKRNVSSYFFTYQIVVTSICKIRHRTSICDSGYQRENSISLI
jgi:hypothetical protein